MTDDYNPTQNKVWSSALNVSKKIYNLTTYYTEEDLQPLTDALEKAQNLQNQLEEEIKEGDKVTFETEKGQKGLNAVRVKLVVS